jgi:ATP-dependent DNA helicase DinG
MADVSTAIAHRISHAASASMRAAINEAGGREVFFAGSIDKEGLVTAARVVARGTEEAVPAFLHGLDKGDVVIHNHPSGQVAPSAADLQLASVFGFHGHGVYIVDNAVENVYVVVEPFVEKPRARVDAGKLAASLAPGGSVALRLAEFESRPQQVEMLRAVAAAFNDDGIAAIEAPTGVGKTMAYLLPAAAWAQKNRERVVISTRTINLQEQIIQKDIPVAAGTSADAVKAVLVKGRGNYMCWRKLKRALSEASLFDDGGEQSQIAKLKEWAETTTDGSLSDLPFVPDRDVWSNCCSEADTCRLSACPDAQKCFVGRARREVAKADLLVVNHHMLFSDLAIKRETGDFTSLAVLPSYKRVIFDEAHSVEDSATEYFGAEVTRNGTVALLGRFVSLGRGRDRGLLPFLRARLERELPANLQAEAVKLVDLINNDCMPSLAVARDSLLAVFTAVRSWAAARCAQMGRDVKWRLTPAELGDPELRLIHRELVLPACEEAAVFVAQCVTVAERLKAVNTPDEEGDAPFTTELLQLQGYTDRVRRLANTLVELTSDRIEPNTVRWIEIDSDNDSIIRLVRCPLEIGVPMAEWVYPNLRTAVLTSATLTVRQEFDFLAQRIGLDRLKDRKTQLTRLDTPFDFEKQAILCIPEDMPAPDTLEYSNEVVAHTRRILDVTRGHAFVLFTSFSALNRTYDRVAPWLRAEGITPLKQGEMARTPLLERFRSDTSSVLFGTDSFWEGVDVAGDALQCVILTRLPFRVPSEPVLQARAEAIDAAGGRSFIEYTVPQAVIRFRQGFGRLIRRKSDRGAIVILDSRVVTKFYGKIFLQSLPGVRTVRGPGDGVYRALASHLAAGEKSA